MHQRLSPLDVSFLYLETSSTPMHAGSVMVFAPGPAGVDIERLNRHLESRLALVPRYRQRVHAVPGRLANPVWVDDGRFDLGYHVRRSALPRPGRLEQLEELVARLQARPLDRSRPLWELYWVEGLEMGRFAVITKVHQAMVDGEQAVDLGEVLLDDAPASSTPPSPIWRAQRTPTLAELVTGAVVDVVRRPAQVVDTVSTALSDVRRAAGSWGWSAVRVAGIAGRAGLSVGAGGALARSPLVGVTGSQRRFRQVRTRLEDYRVVRAASRSPSRAGAVGLQVSVNDVMLATIAGALRAWLLSRGEAVPSTSVVRALVPISVRAEPQAPGGDRVSALLIDLPTGEASPVVRLHRIAFQTRQHRQSGQAVDAPALVGLAGFAPPTLHLLGARVAAGLSRRVFSLVVTNVPGPQHPRYLTAARMVSTAPVIPLVRGQLLSIGLTSYDGGVWYGLVGDRDGLADLDVLGQCLPEALAELAEAVARTAG